MALVRDHGKAEPPPPKKKRTPPPAPTPSFTRSPFGEKPFAPQQKAAKTQTRRAVQRLPVPAVAAPPVIDNPTPAQVHAAKRQIVQSVNRQLGSSSGAERNARRDEILDQIAHDPRLAGTRKAIAHYSAAEAALNTRESALRNLQDRVSPIPQHKAHIGIGIGPNLATVNLTSLGQAGTNLLGKVAPGLMSGGPEAQFLRNAFKDLGTVATGPFVGAYSGAKAQSSDALRLAHGDTSAILHGDTAHLLEAVAKGYADQVRHPGKAIKEHPLLSALNLAGAESVLGRTGGAVARGVGQTGAAGVRGALADAGTTVRPPIALSEDLAGGVISRTGSKSLSRARVQRAADRTRAPLRDADGNVVTVTDRGREVPVLTPRNPLERAHLNKKRADMLASRANLTERLGREKASHAFKVKGVPRAARDIVSMVADGTITSAAHFGTDLAKHLTRIRGKLAQHDMEVAAGKEPTIYRHEGEVEAARTRAALVEKVLRSPKAMAQAKKIVDVATEHGRRLVEGDKASAEAGLIDADQAHRARLVHAAVEHMGAQHGRDARLTARAQQLAKVERSLRARLNFGHHGQQVTDVAEPLDAATRKAIARNQRKGQPRPPARVRVSGDDAFSTRALPVEKTGGTPHLPANETQWFHGTPTKYEGLPTAKGQWSDLGVYLTSDPHYARGYADAAGAARGERGHILPIRVNAKRVLDMRAGRSSATDLTRVIQALRARIGPAIEKELDSDVYAGDPRYRERRAKTMRQNWDAPLASWEKRLAENGKLTPQEMNGLQETLQHLSENIGSAIGLKGTGNRHQVLAQAMRDAGFDAVRKVDLHADALVVLDESIMRRLSGTEGAPAIRRSRPATPEEARQRIAGQVQAVRHMREDVNARNTERLRDSKGNPLEPHHIEAFLRSKGRDPDTVAYLPTNVSRKQFHAQFRPGSRGSLDKGLTRTGEQQRKGATESSADLLRAAGVRQATTLTKAQQLDKVIGEHGMVHPAAAKAKAGKPLTKHEANVVKRGGYYTGAEAAEVINRAAARGERLVAVSAYPAKLDAETSRIIREDLQGPGAMDGLGQRLLNSRALKEDQLNSSGKARNVVLMNADLIDRLQKHLVPAGTLKKFSQIANRAFRYAVLPQPRWLVGNFFEPLVIRMPGAGSGINVFGMAADIRAGTRGINALRRSGDPRLRAAADEIEGQQFGGLLIGGRGATNKRGLDDFPALDATAQKAYGKIVSKTPAVHEMADLTGRLLRGGGKAILAPLDTIFRINRAGEAVLQRAAFGTSLRRDIQEFTGSWTDTVKLGQKAVQEAAEGLVNTSTQNRYMEAQHELLGQYEGFSPTLRGIIQGVAPFLPYTLAAARFVFLTMPIHRSATASLLIQINNVVSQDWKDQHDGLPPGTGLMIPAGGGKFVDIARYTPYGLSGQAAQGELGGITGNLLPQISGTQQALQGKNPFGDDLQLSSGADPTLSSELGIAGNSLLEAVVPYLSTIRRLREHGETAYSDSTALHPKTKEGTSHGMSAARRTFDPFRPTFFGAEEVVNPPASNAPAAPVDRRTQLLQRRADLLQRSSAGSARRDELLRRRAEILSRSR